MPDPIRWCQDCQKNYPHMEVQETRTRICSKCGMESSFPKGYKLASAARDLEREDKKERVMPKKKMMTKEQFEDVLRETGDGVKDADIAKRYSLSVNTVWRIRHGYVPKGIAKTTSKTGKAAQLTRALEKVDITSSGQTHRSPTGSVKHAIERMVAEAVDRRLAGLGLDTLDAKIETAILRLLK